MQPALVLEPGRGAADRDRGAVRPGAADHPLRQRGRGRRARQRHLGRALRLGLVQRRRARAAGSGAAARRSHLLQQPQRHGGRRARARSAASTRAASAASSAARASSASPRPRCWRYPTASPRTDPARSSSPARGPAWPRAASRRSQPDAARQVRQLIALALACSNSWSVITPRLRRSSSLASSVGG